MEFEARKLEGHCDDLIEIIENNNAIIAGGAVTSIMTNKPINDIDVYFRDAPSFTQAVFDVFNVEENGITGYSGQNGMVINPTDKSLLIKKGESLIQFIYYRFFPTEQDIFNAYDFTINMGAYSPAAKDWTFHPDFFKHNSQRYLHFNPNTDYPIISAMRVQKYKERGYTISKAQMLKILMTITDLKITGWNQFKDHVGGMYGMNVDDLFDTSQPFTVWEATDQLDNCKIPDKLTSIDNAGWESTYNAIHHKLDKSMIDSCKVVHMQKTKRPHPFFK